MHGETRPEVTASLRMQTKLTKSPPTSAQKKLTRDAASNNIHLFSLLLRQHGQASRSQG
jgi:hypothetical protein